MRRTSLRMVQGPILRICGKNEHNLALSTFTIAAGFLTFSVGSSAIHTATEAAAMIGKSGTFCGKVAEVSERRKAVFINLGAPYPNQELIFVLWNDLKPAFVQRFGNLHIFLNRTLCARGTVEKYKGRPEIILSDPGALTVKR